jgi:small GTP-binding protein
MSTSQHKVVLIGESGVGKTCIIAQYTNGKFDPNTVTSLTAQYIRKNVDLPDGETITFDIWDTAGQEKYRALAKIFYKDAKAIILVYDVTSKKSFDEIKNYWYEQIKQLGSENIVIAIAANKYDLYEEKQVSNEEGEEFAKSIGAIFVSTSAKNASGINNLFENIAHKIIDPTFDFAKAEKDKKDAYKKKKKKEKIEEEAAADNKGVKLDAKNLEKKKKGCC